jgi:hypothetical protein
MSNLTNLRTYPRQHDRISALWTDFRAAMHDQNLKRGLEIAEETRTYSPPDADSMISLITNRGFINT